MRRMPWGLVLCILLLGVALASCDGPNRGSNTQPSSGSGFILDLVASPNVIRGASSGSTASPNVGGCALVQAKVSTTKGELVDGTTVNFATSLCCFSDTATSAAGLTQVNVVTTTRGVATVSFCGTTDRGTATITASAEDAFDSVLITVF